MKSLRSACLSWIVWSATNQSTCLSIISLLSSGDLELSRSRVNLRVEKLLWDSFNVGQIQLLRSMHAIYSLIDDACYWHLHISPQLSCNQIRAMDVLLVILWGNNLEINRECISLVQAMLCRSQVSIFCFFVQCCESVSFVVLLCVKKVFNRD